MGKIKRRFQNRSIKTSFIAYMLICILTAVLMSLLLSNLCQTGQSYIYKKYAAAYENSDFRTEIDFHEKTGENMNGTLNFFTEDLTSFFTPFENWFYNTLGFFSIAFYPICFIICIGITSLLFYKREIQKPLHILDAAADLISDNNLNFNIIYERQNELGKLCASFEKMRIALQENNQEMWRQIDERKRLNAAFAHDLRTPLTVLKGQSEMLIKYAPRMPKEKIVTTAAMMQRHIIRLETYVNTMNDLQRLEDIEINKTPVAVSDVIQQMRSTGTSFCQNRTFLFTDTMMDQKKTAGSFLYLHGSEKALRLDFPVVMRVYENLLSNALRFSEETITVSVDVKEDSFYLTVSDDGHGFTEKDLTNATKPFYKSVSETDNGHFGMGLNICRILCEKHGGHLDLANGQGAVVRAVFRQ